MALHFFTLPHHLKRFQTSDPDESVCVRLTRREVPPIGENFDVTNRRVVKNAQM